MLTLFADWDDPDASDIAAAGGVQWVRLGRGSDEYDLDLGFSAEDWQLRHPHGLLTSDEVRRSTRVIFRRWRSSPPRGIVVAPLGVASVTAQYVERQWNAALLGALHRSYLASPARWSRSPLRQDLKILTLDAIGAVVRVPRTTVACSAPGQKLRTVTKAIDVDQSHGSGRVSTWLVGDEDRERRQPVPAFFQDAVAGSVELRLVYAFDQVAVVRRVYPDSAPTDRRHVVPRSTTEIDAAPFVQMAAAVAERLDLRMYTADILEDASGVQFWVDVNPDGLLGASDSASGTFRRMVQRISQLPST